MFNSLRRPSVKNVFLISLAILFVYVFSIRPLNPFEALQLKFHDFLFVNAQRMKGTPTELKEIVLVALDDDSYARVNQRWPWDRSIYATLTDKISLQKPRLILLDVAFGGESQNPESDILLANAFQKAGNVVIASYLGDYGEPVLPLEQIRRRALDYGFVNKPLDSDFVIRRAQPFHWSSEGRLLDTALEVKTASRLLGAIPSMPLRRDGTLFLNYQARREEVPTVPVWKILADQVPPESFKDKIVIFGITNRLMHDIHNSPFGSLPGVLMVVNFLLMILSGATVKEAGVGLNLLVLLSAGFATAHATYRLSLWRGFLFLFYEGVLLLGGTFFLYLKNIHWDFSSAIFSAIFCYLGITFYKYLGVLFENIALKEEAITDGLTQLYAYRYFELRLRNEFERSQRYQIPLSLVFLDIDHFKKINDTYGHEEGNMVLKTIAQILKKNTRRIDLVARYGGEEFCVVLPQTNLEGAEQYAENLRKAVEETPFIVLHSEPLKVTVSLGVASYPRFQVSSGEALVRLTDQALYRAKEGGRNRVCVATDTAAEKTSTP